MFMLYIRVTVLILAVAILPASYSYAQRQSITIDYQVNDATMSYTGFWRGSTFIVDAGFERNVIVATLDWPPYLGRNQCQGGWLLHYMAALLLQAGYNPEFRFLPWARAVRMTELGHADILAPEYEIESSAPSDVIPGSTRLNHLALSSALAHAPVHYVAAADSAITQAPQISELPNYSLGIVRGYQNAPQVDQVIDSGQVIVQQAIDDAQNLNLVVNGRVNLIIGDPLVLHTVASANGIDRAAYRVLQPSITNQPLYFALSKTRPQWQVLMQDINQTIPVASAQQLRQQLTERIDEHCAAQGTY
ncbi:Bacterial extracellular solute-binding protein, family 3 [Pseudoalteromonas sp. THAF3]|uniref:substrate-binding periplasmic protein n=1 Tax=Pseudoalteromonas sp. THAF3 TaxID=2587843 RepID=UPI0012680449|nr:transporter substrate-binding domain-containing protein [Pseudoalteromonas sp. THAF3]QFU05338.1 Bacterial extracellular solute-binding protein, family 3 [Pseudoalteromonas sp. THAF3]